MIPSTVLQTMGYLSDEIEIHFFFVGGDHIGEFKRPLMPTKIGRVSTVERLG